VVLPENTEDVQKVMRIAYAHKIPVVPLPLDSITAAWPSRERAGFWWT